MQPGWARLPDREEQTGSRPTPTGAHLEEGRPRGGSWSRDRGGRARREQMASIGVWNKCRLRVARKHVTWDDKNMRWETTPHACVETKAKA